MPSTEGLVLQLLPKSGLGGHCLDDAVQSFSNRGTGVESSEAHRMASNLGATGGRLGFNITPWSVTSTRASG